MVATYYTRFILLYIVFGTSICVEAQSMSLSDGDEAGAKKGVCMVTAPSSVQIRSDIWKENEIPEEDDLDRFMINKTGCSYKANKTVSTFLPPAATYDGTLFEWRGAVRGHNKTVIFVYWGGSERYCFWIGNGYSRVTRTMTYLAVPDILSPEWYEWLYIRICSGTLQIGRVCDRAPLVSRNVTVSPGEEVKMEISTYSHYGAKLLVDCPADVTSCSFKALRNYEQLNTPAVSFDGRLFEWRGAVQTREDAVIGVWWSPGVGYNFHIGEEGNKITRVYERQTGIEWRPSTPPMMLSEDRYVYFYIRISAGTLTFGRECGSEPLFSRAVSVRQGQQLVVGLASYSPSGANFLYNCPV